MISNIFIILLIAAFVIAGVRRGAARTLLSFAAMTANAMISNFLSGIIARAVYDSFIRARVLSNLEGLIADNGARFAADNSIQALPDGMKGLLGFLTGLFGATPEQLQGRLSVPSEVTESAARSMEQPLGELSVVLLSVVIAAVIFAVLAIVFRLLIRFTLGFFEIPVIKQVNMILGGVFGLLEGIVLVCVLVNVSYLLLSYANPSVLENTTVFGGLYHTMNIFK